MSLNDLQHTISVPVVILAMSCLLQLFYYLFFYLKVAAHKEKKKTTIQEVPVSVVVAARNEAENLQQHLPSLLKQDYPNFEVIVINDCSTDNSDEVLSELKRQYPTLRVSTIDENGKFTQGKKLALTVGIKAAQNEWILFTDADCKPASENWIRMMLQQRSDEQAIILGYGGYASKKSILNNLIRFDTFFIALQYLGFAKAGIPYMGVGRNLAYKKTLFFEQKGFASHLKLRSGDDDLFINKAASKKNTAVSISKESKTLSIPKSHVSEWIRQKKRHLTTSSYYTYSSKLLIGMENISRLLFFISTLYLLINQTLTTPVLITLGIRYLVQWTVFFFAMRRLGEKYLLLPSFLWDIILPLINAYCMLSNKFSTQNSIKYA